MKSKGNINFSLKPQTSLVEVNGPRSVFFNWDQYKGERYAVKVELGIQKNTRSRKEYVWKFLDLQPKREVTMQFHSGIQAGFKPKTSIDPGKIVYEKAKGKLRLEDSIPQMRRVDIEFRLKQLEEDKAGLEKERAKIYDNLKFLMDKLRLMDEVVVYSDERLAKSYYDGVLAKLASKFSYNLGREEVIYTYESGFQMGFYTSFMKLLKSCKYSVKTFGIKLPDLKRKSIKIRRKVEESRDFNERKEIESTYATLKLKVEVERDSDLKRIVSLKKAYAKVQEARKECQKKLEKQQHILDRTLRKIYVKSLLIQALKSAFQGHSFMLKQGWEESYLSILSEIQKQVLESEGVKPTLRLEETGEIYGLYLLLLKALGYFVPKEFYSFQSEIATREQWVLNYPIAAFMRLKLTDKRHVKDIEWGFLRYAQYFGEDLIALKTLDNIFRQYVKTGDLPDLVLACIHNVRREFKDYLVCSSDINFKIQSLVEIANKPKDESSKEIDRHFISSSLDFNYLLSQGETESKKSESMGSKYEAHILQGKLNSVQILFKVLNQHKKQWFSVVKAFSYNPSAIVDKSMNWIRRWLKEGFGFGLSEYCQDLEKRFSDAISMTEVTQYKSQLSTFYQEYMVKNNRLQEVKQRLEKANLDNKRVLSRSLKPLESELNGIASLLRSEMDMLNEIASYGKDLENLVYSFRDHHNCRFPLKKWLELIKRSIPFMKLRRNLSSYLKNHLNNLKKIRTWFEKYWDKAKKTKDVRQKRVMLRTYWVLRARYQAKKLEVHPQMLPAVMIDGELFLHFLGIDYDAAFEEQRQSGAIDIDIKTRELLLISKKREVKRWVFDRILGKARPDFRYRKRLERLAELENSSKLGFLIYNRRVNLDDLIKRRFGYKTDKNKDRIALFSKDFERRYKVLQGLQVRFLDIYAKPIEERIEMLKAKDTVLEFTEKTLRYWHYMAEIRYAAEKYEGDFLVNYANEIHDAVQNENSPAFKFGERFFGVKLVKDISEKAMQGMPEKRQKEIRKGRKYTKVQVKYERISEVGLRYLAQILKALHENYRQKTRLDLLMKNYTYSVELPDVEVNQDLEKSLDAVLKHNAQIVRYIEHELPIAEEKLAIEQEIKRLEQVKNPISKIVEEAFGEESNGAVLREIDQAIEQSEEDESSVAKATTVYLKTLRKAVSKSKESGKTFYKRLLSQNSDLDSLVPARYRDKETGKKWGAIELLDEYINYCNTQLLNKLYKRLDSLVFNLDLKSKAEIAPFQPIEVPEPYMKKFISLGEESGLLGMDVDDERGLTVHGKGQVLEFVQKQSESVNRLIRIISDCSQDRVSFEYVTQGVMKQVLSGQAKINEQTLFDLEKTLENEVKPIVKAYFQIRAEDTSNQLRSQYGMYTTDVGWQMNSVKMRSFVKNNMLVATEAGMQMLGFGKNSLDKLFHKFVWGEMLNGNFEQSRAVVALMGIHTHNERFIMGNKMLGQFYKKASNFKIESPEQLYNIVNYQQQLVRKVTLLSNQKHAAPLFQLQSATNLRMEKVNKFHEIVAKSCKFMPETMVLYTMQQTGVDVGLSKEAMYKCMVAAECFNIRDIYSERKNMFLSKIGSTLQLDMLKMDTKVSLESKESYLFFHLPDPKEPVFQSISKGILNTDFARYSKMVILKEGGTATAIARPQVLFRPMSNRDKAALSTIVEKYDPARMQDINLRRFLSPEVGFAQQKEIVSIATNVQANVMQHLGIEIKPTLENLGLYPKKGMFYMQNNEQIAEEINVVNSYLQRELNMSTNVKPDGQVLKNVLLRHTNGSFQEVQRLSRLDFTVVEDMIQAGKKSIKAVVQETPEQRFVKLLEDDAFDNIEETNVIVPVVNPLYDYSLTDKVPELDSSFEEPGEELPAIDIEDILKVDKIPARPPENYRYNPIKRMDLEQEIAEEAIALGREKEEYDIFLPRPIPFLPSVEGDGKQPFKVFPELSRHQNIDVPGLKHSDETELQSILTPKKPPENPPKRPPPSRRDSLTETLSEEVSELMLNPRKGLFGRKRHRDDFHIIKKVKEYKFKNEKLPKGYNKAISRKIRQLEKQRKEVGTVLEKEAARQILRRISKGDLSADTDFVVMNFAEHYEVFRDQNREETVVKDPVTNLEKEAKSNYLIVPKTQILG